MNTVSLNFDVEGLNEKNYQELVLKKLKNNRHTNCVITKDNFFNEVKSILDKMDQPSCDGVNSHFVSIAAKNAGLKSVLSGVGGDELFGGPLF